MITTIISASIVSMSDARLQNDSVNIVDFEVPCSASCVRYTCLKVVLNGQCELVCFDSVHVRDKVEIYSVYDDEVNCLMYSLYFL